MLEIMKNSCNKYNGEQKNLHVRIYFYILGGLHDSIYTIIL